MQNVAQDVQTSVVEGLNRTVGCDPAHILGLGNVTKLIQVRSVIIAALSDIESTAIAAICDVRDEFPVEASSGALSPPAGGSSNQAYL